MVVVLLDELTVVFREEVEATEEELLDDTEVVVFSDEVDDEELEEFVAFTSSVDVGETVVPTVVFVVFAEGSDGGGCAYSMPNRSKTKQSFTMPLAIG